MLINFLRDACSKEVRSTLFQQTFCNCFLNFLHAICIFKIALTGTCAYIVCASIWVFKWQFYIWNAVKLFVNYQMHHFIEPIIYSKDCYNSRYCGREVFWDCLAWRGPLMTPLPGNYLICATPILSNTKIDLQCWLSFSKFLNNLVGEISLFPHLENLTILSHMPDNWFESVILCTIMPERNTLAYKSLATFFKCTLTLTLSLHLQLH